LESYATEDWKIYDKQFERGEISLEECLRKQFSTVIVPEAVILQDLKHELSIRSSFPELIRICETNNIPAVIVSAGLEFVIKHVLKENGWIDYVQVYAPLAQLSSEGIKLSMPSLHYKNSVNFKDDQVEYHRRQGKQVLYVGDGIADFYAAKRANFPFAIKNSKLAEHLTQKNIPHQEIDDFRAVTETVIRLIKEYGGSQDSS
jgi:2-hydroxy-3-keto-5-methylthiopentenyl-1-phosphate phosphatase